MWEVCAVSDARSPRAVRWRRDHGLCRGAVLQLRLPILCRRSRPLQTPKAFDVVSNRREMNLEFGFGKPDPSHRAKMIAAFPGAENFLDARPDWPQRAVVRFEPFGGQPAMALRMSFDVPPLALIATSTESAS